MQLPSPISHVPQLKSPLTLTAMFLFNPSCVLPSKAGSQLGGMPEAIPPVTNDQAVNDSQIRKIAKACSVVLKASEAMLPTPLSQIQRIVLQEENLPSKT